MQLDMRLGYRARLGARRTLDIFCEMFNVTDRANFTNPSGNRRVIADFLRLTGLVGGTGFPRQSQIGLARVLTHALLAVQIGRLRTVGRLLRQTESISRLPFSVVRLVMPAIIMRLPMQFRRMLRARRRRSLLLGAAAPAQAPQTPPSVTFQVEVNYVDVDAIVTDERAISSPGLTRDDFEVFEDGKPQKVEMFSYVELPVEPPDRFALLGRPVSTDARSNARALRRPRLRDRARRPRHQPAANGARQEVGARVRRAPSRRERPRRGRVHQRAHATRRRISRTIARCCWPPSTSSSGAASGRPPSKPSSGTTTESSPARTVQDERSRRPGAGITDAAAPINIRDIEREQRALAVLDTLRNLGEFLAGVARPPQGGAAVQRGHRDADERDLRHPHGHRRRRRHQGRHHRGGAIERQLLRPRSARPDRHDERIHRAGGIGRARRGHWARSASLNAQQGLLTEMKLSQDSLRTLAEETGGFAAVNQNTLGSAFGRIVDANSRYYVLGYYPPTTARDGRFHRIEVRVKAARAARVGAQRYASPRGRTPAERKRDEETRRAREAKRGAANNTSPELRDALNAPLQQSGLTFTVQAAPFKHTQKDASVALAIEFDGEPLAVHAARQRRAGRQTPSSCRSSASTRTARRSGRRDRSSTSRCGRTRSSASRPAGCASIRG